MGAFGVLGGTSGELFDSSQGTFKVLSGIFFYSLGDILGPSKKLQVKCVNMFLLSLVMDSQFSSRNVTVW